MGDRSPIRIRDILTAGIGIGFWALLGAAVQLTGPLSGTRACRHAFGPSFDRLGCGAVVVGRSQLGRCHRLDAAGKVEARQLGTPALPTLRVLFLGIPWLSTMGVSCRGVIFSCCTNVQRSLSGSGS